MNKVVNSARIILEVGKTFSRSSVRKIEKVILRLCV